MPATVPLSEKQKSQAAWWKRFFPRIKFPTQGNFFIVPGEDRAGDANLVHETGRKIDFSLDEGETWAACRDTFAAALPDATVSLPTCCKPEDAPRPVAAKS